MRVDDFEGGVGVDAAIQCFVGGFVGFGPLAYWLAFEVAGTQFFSGQLCKPVGGAVCGEMGVAWARAG